jgi:hypothetical protein
LFDGSAVFLWIMARIARIALPAPDAVPLPFATVCGTGGPSPDQRFEH